jgi:hypothetical protein
MLGGLTAIHSAGRIYGVNPARSLAGLPSSMTIRYTEEAHGEIEHPVVRTHVETDASASMSTATSRSASRT